MAIRGGPAKTVVRDNRSEGSNPSLAARCGNAAVFNAFKAKGLRAPVSSALLEE